MKSNPVPLKTEADLLYDAGDYQAAVDTYLKILNDPAGVEADTNSLVFNQIGLCYYFLEEYEHAASYFKKYLFHLNKQACVEETDKAVAMLNIANVLSYTSDQEEALKYYLASLNAYLEFSDEDSEPIPELNNSIGNTCNKLKKYDIGEKYYTRALELSEKVSGSENEQTILYRYNLAQNHHNNNKIDEAYKQYAIVYKHLGGENTHIDKIEVLNNLTNACQSIQTDLAHRVYFEHLFIECVREYGNDDMNAAIAALKLGRYCNKTKDFPAAIKYFDITLAVYNSNKGELDPESIKVTNELAFACYSNKQFDRAKELFGFVLAYYRKHLQKHDNALLSSIVNTAFSAYHSRDMDAAEKLFEETLRESESNSSVETGKIAEYQSLLAEIYYKNKKYEKAASILKSEIKNKIEQGQTDPVELGDRYAILAQVLRFMSKKAPEAKFYFDEAIKLYEKSLEQHHRKILDAKIKLASLFSSSLSDVKSALQILTDVWDVLISKQMAESRFAMTVVSDMGNIHYAEKNYQHAMDCFEKGLQIIDKSEKKSEEQKIRFLKGMARVEIGLNHKDMAHSHLKEAYIISEKYFGKKHDKTNEILNLIRRNFDSEKLREITTESFGISKIEEYKHFIKEELGSEFSKRKVRVFISSTFRDMMAERDYLMKTIFPELKKLCQEHGIDFSEVDLRWGVTEEEAEQGRVIEICLNEIDKSRPYFIGILGERYGWIPDKSMLSKIKRTLENFDWLNNDINNKLSITEMEIQYGVLRNIKMEGNAFFYLRDKTLTPGPEFVEQKGSIELKKLQRLKTKLHSQKKYPVSDFNSIKQLGESIYHDLQKAIIRDTKLDRELSNLEKNRIPQLHFIKKFLQYYIPIKKPLLQLNQFIESDSNTLTLFSPAGTGKSALLSNWIREMSLKNDKEIILFHFAEADPQHTDIQSILQRIMLEIKNLFEFEFDASMADPASALGSFFSKSEINSRIIIVIDGIERIKYNTFFTRLYWLPQHIPNHIKLIVSTNNTIIRDDLTARGFKTIKQGNLTNRQKKQLIKGYLSGYGKKLPVGLDDRILEDESSVTPYSMKIILDELRLFGKHEELEKELDKYLSAANMEALFLKVIDRIEKDYDNDFPGLTAKALSLLAISKGGLSQEEVISMTDAAPLYWAPIENSLGNYLFYMDGLISIQDKNLLAAIGTKYLTDEKSIRQIKRILIDHLSSTSEAKRKADEMCELLYELNDKEKLVAVITDLDVFRELLHQSRQEDFIRYKNLVQDEHDIADYFSMHLEKETWHDNNLLEKAELLLKISSIVLLDGRTEKALIFAKESYMIRKNILGDEHPNTADAMIEMAGIYVSVPESQVKAKEIYLKAISIIEGNPYKTGIRIAGACRALSLIFLQEDEDEEAWKYSEKAKQHLESAFGVNTIALVEVYNTFGSIELKRGNLVEAEQYCTKAMSLAENSLGANSMLYQASLIDLIRVYEEKGEDQKALDTLLSSEKIVSTKLGESHTISTATKFILASKYFQKKEFDRAGELSIELLQTAMDNEQLESEYATGALDLLKKIYSLAGQEEKINALAKKFGMK